MIIKGYKAECCGRIFDKHGVFGVSAEKDMFDLYSSFKTIHIDKATVHYCVECYSEKVVMATQRLIRRKDNEGNYQAKLKEMAYVFKKSLFSNGLAQI